MQNAFPLPHEDRATWLRLAAALLELYAALAAHSRDAAAGAQLLPLLALNPGKSSAAQLTASVARLLAGKADGLGADEAGAAMATLRFAAALAELIGRQPAVQQVLLSSPPHETAVLGLYLCGQETTRGQPLHLKRLTRTC